MPATPKPPRDSGGDAPRPRPRRRGDPALLAAKSDLRDEAWTALEDAGAARFPGARNRIPNVTGAEAAAERLRATDAWQRAHVVKCNPDSPQWIDLVVQGCVAVDEHGARLGPSGPVTPALHRDALTDEKVASIPVLGRLLADGPGNGGQ